MISPASDVLGAATASARRLPTVGRMFEAACRLYPDRMAIGDGERRLSYADLQARVRSLAAALHAGEVRSGDVVAILSENRAEYIEVELACALLGVTAACLNWRQVPEELERCIRLVEPKRLFLSPRFKGVADALAIADVESVMFEDAYEALLTSRSPAVPDVDVDPEAGLLILYTSGTTGFPKGALISHRAMIARSLFMMAEWSVLKTDGCIAWSPLFHMAGNDPTICSLIQGGPVRVIDGFDTDAICTALEEIPVGWLVLMPGTIERFIACLKRRKTKVKRVAAAGCMANLVPPEQIAEVTALLNAPYLNSFGSTETGIVPASGSLLPIGQAPRSFGKLPTAFSDVRLVGDDGQPVPTGSVGEICVRSPTLFSGYWNAPETTERDFRDGWFHMGDDFVENQDGTLDFVDRRKYMIKSGGENIYPAEIERLLLASDRIEAAVVVRQPDAKWGEIPVLFVVPRDPSLDESAVQAFLDGRIAPYKRPKRIIFAPGHWIERNVTGKIRRDLLEQRLAGALPTEVAS